MVTTIITAMAAYSNERVAAIVISVLYRMLTNINTATSATTLITHTISTLKRCRYVCNTSFICHTHFRVWQMCQTILVHLPHFAVEIQAVRLLLQMLQMVLHIQCNQENDVLSAIKRRVPTCNTT